MFLALIAMFNVVISLYYYLLVLKAAYFLPSDADAPAIRLPAGMKLITAGLIFLIVAGGIYPTIFISIADAMTRGLMMF